MQHNMFSYHLTRRRNIPLSIGTRNNARDVRIIQKKLWGEKSTPTTQGKFSQTNALNTAIDSICLCILSYLLHLKSADCGPPGRFCSTKSTELASKR